MDYIIPEIPRNFDDFDKADYVATIRNATTSNKHIYMDAIKDWKALIQQAGFLYGDKSKVVRYLRQQAIPKPPNLDRKCLKPTVKKYERYLATIAQRERAKDYRERVKQANDLLASLGYEDGVDYQSTSAITFMKRAIRANGDGLYTKLITPKSQQSPFEYQSMPPHGEVTPS